MKQFIGVKLINTIPMTRLEYNRFRGWQLPADENGDDEGFLVEYSDGGKANTAQYAGYVSWSPKDVFERAYRPIDNLPFGLAIEALKQGSRVTRAGWNGKNMWLSLSGTTDGTLTPAEKFWSRHNFEFAVDNGGAAMVLPSISMKTADNKILMGWLASQSDMLAEDWMVLP